MTIEVNTVSKEGRYLISTGDSQDPRLGDWARGVLGETARKLLIVSNPKVFGLYGDAVRDGLESAGFSVSIWLMPDGERHKNLRILNRLLQELGNREFSRSDAIVALGGGVVGDLAGFAASIYLRGIRFLQLPTTLLSMIDSSVGGKTGVNTDFGKNLVGAFHQPSGVMIDVRTIRSLPRREVVAGFCEAVKHGSISDDNLLQLTADFLTAYPTRRFASHFGDSEFENRLADLILRQVGFKARIVSGDPFEDMARTDSASRKILNFGHTLAHALEKVTGYRYFRHGEAVGYGMIFAAKLSNSLDFIAPNRLTLFNRVVRLVGKLPDTQGIDPEAVLDAFRADKKFVAGKLQFVLLKDIGAPTIVSSNNVPELSIRNALNDILSDSEHKV